MNNGEGITFTPVPKSEAVLQNTQNSWAIWNILKSRRYMLAILMSLGHCNSFILRSNLSTGIVAMNKNNKSIAHADGTITYEESFNWDTQMHSDLLRWFFYAYMTTQLLGGWLAAKFGGKRIFGIGIGATVLCTLVTPIAAKVGFYLLLSVRILEGIFEGVTIPSMYAIWSKWAPPLERSRLASIAFFGGYTGTVVTMPLCTYLNQALGWESIFYVTGGMGALWFAIWLIFVAETPEKDKFISSTELEYIKAAINDQQLHEETGHPWVSIISSVPVMVNVFAHFVFAWGLYTMLAELSILMWDVFDNEQTRMLIAVPYVMTPLVTLLSGYLADYLRTRKVFTTTQVRKLFTCGPFLIAATCLTLAAHIPLPIAKIISLAVGIGFCGSIWSGFGINYLDLAPQHASVLYGIGSTVEIIPSIVIPYSISFLISTDGVNGWKKASYIASAEYVLGAAMYGLMASGELLMWAKRPTPSTTLPVGPPIVTQDTPL